jgi:putative membrane protein
MADKINKIIDDIRDKPTDMLALGRTLMANERTLLGHARTALGLLGGGIALIKYFDDLSLEVIGWFLVVSSVFSIALGVKRYYYMKNILIKAHAKMRSS